MYNLLYSLGTYIAYYYIRIPITIGAKTVCALEGQVLYILYTAASSHINI